MTRFPLTNLPEWAFKTDRRLTAILNQSTNDAILLASRTATGISRGGTRKKGYVPRSTGNLASSLTSELWGTASATAAGEGSYSFVVGKMKPGSVASFRWTAPYARRLHYGFKGTDSRGRTFNQKGWFWVDEAANRWKQIVSNAVKRARAQIR